jgi:hypothetical protein
MNAPLTLHIDRLVLDGLALTSAQTVRMQRAMELELARLWHARESREGTTAYVGAVLRAPAISLAGAALPSPARLGRDVARSMFRAVWSA